MDFLPRNVIKYTN